MIEIKDKAKYLAAHHFKGKDATKRATAWLMDALTKRCAYCDCELTLDNIQLDHRLPKNPLNSYTESDLEYVNSDGNFVQSCRDCNLAKGALTSNEFLRLLVELERWEKTLLYSRLASGNATVKYIVGVLKKHNSEKGKRRR